MSRRILLVLILGIFTAVGAQTDSLVIQEQELGLCTWNGTIVTSSGSISGWTGSGFIDVENGIGKAVSWEIYVQAEGTFLFTWRYAFGGTATNLRDARLLIDGNSAVDSLLFPYTTTWSNWAEITPVPVHLSAGDHKIRLEALCSGGLANLDYLKILGSGLSAWECSPQYTLKVGSNDTSRGSVSYGPVQALYDKGTMITLRARARPSFFFQSWTGDEPGADSLHSFAIRRDVTAVARFLPEAVLSRIDTTILGYATVQDDRGTPWLVTGGDEGETVAATTLEELRAGLESPGPCTVQFSGEIAGSTVIAIQSNKTLLGVGKAAHLRGIELAINGARNVIIRNVILSHVPDAGETNDAMSINGGSQNIVIDRCEFFSDRDHGKDYYDGLLDIKNRSSFITVSNCAFHDHWKAILISSGDTQYADSLIRITLHHNHFYNIGSRLPLIRFGKAHIFNNFYQNCDDAINTRMGACVRVERNYFENVGKGLFSDYSAAEGFIQLVDNHFGGASYITAPLCSFDPPYAYADRMHEVELLPALVPARAGTLVPADEVVAAPGRLSLSQNYPNPFNPVTLLRYYVPGRSSVTITVYDRLGKEVTTLVDGLRSGENRVEFRGDELPTGIYFITLRAGVQVVTRKILLLR